MDMIIVYKWLLQSTSTQIGHFLTSIVFAARRTILTVIAELPWNPEPRGIIGGQI